MKEIWKDIKGYEGRYRVSNLGKVKSLHYGKERIMKPFTTGALYLKVNLHRHPKAKTFSIHRLVGLHFLDYKKARRCINHKDGNPQNNIVENLEWVTPSENIKHAYRIGLCPSRKGENNGFPNKLNRFQVQRIKLMKEVTSSLGYGKIAKMFNVSKPLIYKIIKRKAWGHVI